MFANEEKPLTIAEAAMELRVCEDTVRRLIARRDLESFQVGRTDSNGKRRGIRIRPAALAEFIARQTTPANPKPPTDPKPPPARRRPTRRATARR